MQMALFLVSLYRSFSLFPSGHLVLSFSLFCCVAPSYIKQAVSLAALGDIALIFQRWGTGVMQCAAMDTLHENLSLLKWAKSGRASLSDTGIYLWRSFLFFVLCYCLTRTSSSSTHCWKTGRSLRCDMRRWRMSPMSRHQARARIRWDRRVNVPMFPNRGDSALPFAAVISAALPFSHRALMLPELKGSARPPLLHLTAAPALVVISN